MRRFLLGLAVAAMMAVMLVVTALPALAQGPPIICPSTQHPIFVHSQDQFFCAPKGQPRRD